MYATHTAAAACHIVSCFARSGHEASRHQSCLYCVIHRVPLSAHSHRFALWPNSRTQNVFTSLAAASDRQCYQLASDLQAAMMAIQDTAMAALLPLLLLLPPQVQLLLQLPAQVMHHAVHHCETATSLLSIFRQCVLQDIPSWALLSSMCV